MLGSIDVFTHETRAPGILNSHIYEWGKKRTSQRRSIIVVSVGAKGTDDDTIRVLEAGVFLLNTDNPQHNCLHNNVCQNN